MKMAFGAMGLALGPTLGIELLREKPDMKVPPYTRNAAEVFAAYTTQLNSLTTEAVSDFAARPPAEVTGFLDRHCLEMPVEFGLASLTAIVTEREYQLARRVLRQAIEQYRPGLPEAKQVIRQGLMVVKAGVAAGEWENAIRILDILYENCPLGSPEERQVVEAGMEMVDGCMGQNWLNLAERLLLRAKAHYPFGSRGRNEVMERQRRLGEVMARSADSKGR